MFQHTYQGNTHSTCIHVHITTLTTEKVMHIHILAKIPTMLVRIETQKNGVLFVTSIEMTGMKRSNPAASLKDNLPKSPPGYLEVVHYISYI